MMIIDMEKLHFGDIVLLKFPFTSQNKLKKRPAFVLLDTDDGDFIVCRITSKIYKTGYDFLMENWGKAGLKLPSVVRIHKIASLEKSLIDQKIGKIPDADKQLVKRKLNELVANL